MDKSLHDRIVAIATEVRYWAEAKAQDDRYEDGPTSRLIQKLAGHKFDLNGYCAIAASELYKRLTAAGIRSEIQLADADWGCHCYCVVDDHVIDVTATQFPEFRNKEVVILHSKMAEEHEYYRPSATFGCSKELRRYQKNHKWPSEQICYA